MSAPVPPPQNQSQLPQPPQQQYPSQQIDALGYPIQQQAQQQGYPQQSYPHQQYPQQQYSQPQYPQQQYPPQQYPQQQQSQPLQVQNVIVDTKKPDPVWDNAPAHLKYLWQHYQDIVGFQVQIPVYSFVGVVLLAYASEQCKILGISLFEGLMDSNSSSNCLPGSFSYPICGLPTALSTHKSLGIEALIGVLMIIAACCLGIAYGSCAACGHCKCVPFCCLFCWDRDRVITYGQKQPPVTTTITNQQPPPSAQIVPAVLY